MILVCLRPRSSVASAPSASSFDPRDDLAVTEEQLIQLADEADDARLRALVSETPLAEREHRKASRHADRLRKHRDTLSAKIAALDAEQDELLDRFGAT